MRAGNRTSSSPGSPTRNISTRPTSSSPSSDHTNDARTIPTSSNSKSDSGQTSLPEAPIGPRYSSTNPPPTPAKVSNDPSSAAVSSVGGGGSLHPASNPTDNIATTAHDTRTILNRTSFRPCHHTTSGHPPGRAQGPFVLGGCSGWRLAGDVGPYLHGAGAAETNQVFLPTTTPGRWSTLAIAVLGVGGVLQVGDVEAPCDHHVRHDRGLVPG